jgi:hypothetical protein
MHFHTYVVTCVLVLSLPSTWAAAENADSKAEEHILTQKERNEDPKGVPVISLERFMAVDEFQKTLTQMKLKIKYSIHDGKLKGFFETEMVDKGGKESRITPDPSTPLEGEILPDGDILMQVKGEGKELLFGMVMGKDGKVKFVSYGNLPTFLDTKKVDYKKLSGQFQVTHKNGNKERIEHDFITDSLEKPTMGYYSNRPVPEKGPNGELVIRLGGEFENMFKQETVKPAYDAKSGSYTFTYFDGNSQDAGKENVLSEVVVKNGNIIAIRYKGQTVENLTTTDAK